MILNIFLRIKDKLDHDEPQIVPFCWQNYFLLIKMQAHKRLSPVNGAQNFLYKLIDCVNSLFLKYL